MAEVQKQDPMGERQDTELFYMLVRMISTNALLAMGKIVPEGQQPPPPDLEAAAVFVDMLGMLAEKTEGKRNHDEDQIVKGALNQLQMVFIELARQQGGVPGAHAEHIEAAHPEPAAVQPPVEPAPSTPPPTVAAPEKKIETPSAAEQAKDEKVKYRKSYGA